MNFYFDHLKELLPQRALLIFIVTISQIFHHNGYYEFLLRLFHKIPITTQKNNPHALLMSVQVISLIASQLLLVRILVNRQSFS